MAKPSSEDIPILSLAGKDFLTGLAQMGSHAPNGGLFYKAAGVTPLFGAGAALNANNGLLMAGAAGTALSGTFGGSVINAIADGGISPIFQSSGALGAIFAADDNKIYKLLISGGAPSGSVSAALTIGNTLTGGLIIFLDSTNTARLFYKQLGYIGRYTPSGAVQADTWQAISTDWYGTLYVHYGLNAIFFGNGGGKIGKIANDLTVTLAALTFDAASLTSAISDDGIYVVVALTRNFTGDSSILLDSRIVYWDGSTTTGFLRDFVITDPLIYSLQKTPMGLFAFGLTGIWQVTISGVKKVFDHPPGVYTVGTNSGIHYGRATSFFSDALLWGGQVGSSTARALKSFGKLDSAAVNAYLQPVLGTVSKNITHVNGQILKGQVLIADDTPQAVLYPIGSGTPQTGVSAQTIYFQFPQPYDISRIVVTFGTKLASGDTLTVAAFKDEDTSSVAFGAVSYNANKTIRRWEFRPSGMFEVSQQMSILLTFTAGAVKIKKIEVFGIPKSLGNP